MSEINPLVKKCSCEPVIGTGKRVVITGGPGAGKTAILEIARKHFCERISILPEAASIIFSGGFWRHDTLPAKKAAQRAIFHIQKELEQLVEEEQLTNVALCDRGTLDSLAYWPGDEKLFWKEVGSSKEIELSRYAVVIHLRTPPIEKGYNHQNPVRTESAEQAAEIDKRIAVAWQDHPRRFFVDSHLDFLEKVNQAMTLIKNELPDCCQKHPLGDGKNMGCEQ